MPYAPGGHPWKMSALRVRKSWWEKHNGEFERLEGELFLQWCVEQHQNKDFSIVIVVTDSAACDYSATEGLTEDGVDCPEPDSSGAYPRWRGERDYSKQTIVYNYWFIPFLTGGDRHSLADYGLKSFFI